VDRKSKIKKIRTEHGGVSRVYNLERTQKFIHQDYKSEYCDGIRGETGKLEVLKLISNSTDDPHFTARWDQGAEHLDIDMHNASRSAIGKFKNNRGGYRGHHTVRSPNLNKRIFEIEIKTPRGLTFEGEVSFNNTFEVKATLTAKGHVSVSMQVIRANRNEQGT
jgi:hypothetical protein